MNLKKLILILVSASLTLIGHADVQYFLHFPQQEITGDTEDNEMKPLKALELIDFEFGAENTISIGSISAGGGAGKATFKEFTITSRIGSKQTAQMLKLLTMGDHADEAIITARTTTGGGAGSVEIFKISMKLVMFQDVSITASSGDQALLTAVIQFGAMKVETKAFEADGTIDQNGGGNVEWSRVLNEANYAVE